ncbi:MAG: YggS family pyridoxal phosphate-dependent enzyme [Oscillospiraceae bacterium]|nr:YggS family pyridoxal phosphate-dependent enzyme [Oscillospiraceae bacterium]
METEFAVCTQEQIDAMLQRLQTIRRNIAEACNEAGRSADEVTLMAVTKTVAPDLINAAVDAGVNVLGENRVQEFLSKKDFYRPGAEVQFIGHLQTNKVKQIIDKVTLIHSVDSVHLAEAVSKAAQQQGITMPVLLEVNIGGEISKSGTAPEAVRTLLEHVLTLPNIRVDGLMTIPPPTTDAAEQDAVFARMQEIYQEMQKITPMHVLSMGMSGDYAAAVRRGATLVRIGSGLFGARLYPPQNSVV